MEINWDEVVSGKTILVWDAGHGFQDTEFHIIHTFGDSVWYRTNGFGVPLTAHKSNFKNCHIKEEWREITDKCRYEKFHSSHEWLRLVIVYQGRVISICDLDQGLYKIEGYRVFTCT